MSWFGIILTRAWRVQGKSPVYCKQPARGRKITINIWTYVHCFSVYKVIFLYNILTNPKNSLWWSLLLYQFHWCGNWFGDPMFPIRNCQNSNAVSSDSKSCTWPWYLTMCLQSPEAMYMGQILRVLLRAGREQLQYAFWSNRDSGTRTTQNCDIYIWSLSSFLCTNSPPLCFLLSFFIPIVGIRVRD